MSLRDPFFSLLAQILLLSKTLFFLGRQDNSSLEAHFMVTDSLKALKLMIAISKVLIYVSKVKTLYDFFK